MANARLIYSDIWSSESFLRLSEPAKLLWFGLITTADDHGRGHACPVALKARFFPLVKVQISEISRFCNEIESENMAIFRNLDGSSYFQICKWNKYQHIRWQKRSLLPEISDSNHKTAAEENRIEENRIETSSRPKDGRGPYIDWEMVLLTWNQELSRIIGAPPIREMTEDRKSKARARLAEHPNLWVEIRNESTKLGKFAKEKRFITFDFLMSPTKLTKFLEGNYRDKSYVEQRPTGPTEEDIQEDLKNYLAKLQQAKKRDNEQAGEPGGIESDNARWPDMDPILGPDDSPKGTEQHGGDTVLPGDV